MSGAAPTVDLFHGDCLEVMRGLEAASCDALVCDPPAGVSFMQAKWDDPKFMDSFPLRDRGKLNGTPEHAAHKHGHGFARGMTYEHSPRGRDAFVAFLSARLAEARRLLKPGAFALVWALPRTSHWTALAIEEAGFTIRDRVAHVFGCLSEDTEILTPDGWVHFRKLVESDPVCAYNVDSDTFRWERVEEVLVYDYAETAYAIRSDSTDQLVSRNHRCPVLVDGRWEFIPAEEAARRRQAIVPVVEDVRGLLDALPLPQQDPGQAEQGVLAGLREHTDRPEELGEETARPDLPALRRIVPTGPSVQGAGEAQVLLDDLRGGGAGGRPRVPGEPQADRVERQGRMDGGVAGVLLGEDDGGRQPGVEGRGDDLQAARQLRWRPLRPLPFDVRRDGSPRWLCDGASTDRGDGVGTALAPFRGRSPRQSRPGGQPDGEPAPLRQQPRPQAPRTPGLARADLATVEPVEYRGVVWCVRVPSGAFVARRNGKVFVTGNSGFPKSKSCLKPAVEDWWLCKAPGPTRDLNIDACRVAAAGESLGGGRVSTKTEGWDRPWKHDAAAVAACKERGEAAVAKAESLGRYPPNLCLSHAPGCRRAGVRRVKGTNRSESSATARVWCEGGGWKQKKRTNQTGPDGTEAIEAWECVDSCPVRQLDLMSGERKAAYGNQFSADAKTAENKPCNGIHTAYGKGMENKPAGPLYSDRGGASRFFPRFAPDGDDGPDGPLWTYQAKASRSDRHGGCDDLYWARDPRRPSGYRFITEAEWARLPEKERARGNIHSTVKATPLMRWLVRLVTPPGGTVLDGFAGSGSTAVACAAEGLSFVGAETNEDYHLIARRRIDHARAAMVAEAPLFSGGAP